MWTWAMIAVAAVVVAPLLARQTDDEHRVQDAGEGQAMAERMAVLRSAAQAWAHAHPTFDGPLEIGRLDTPAWWRGDAALHVLVQGRVVAVYASGDRPARGLMPQMLRLSGGSVWVGTADRHSGTLHSPTLGDTGIAVPAAVPDSAPVWLVLRD